MMPRRQRIHSHLYPTSSPRPLHDTITILPATDPPISGIAFSELPYPRHPAGFCLHRSLSFPVPPLPSLVSGASVFERKPPTKASFPPTTLYLYSSSFLPSNTIIYKLCQYEVRRCRCPCTPHIIPPVTAHATGPDESNQAINTFNCGQKCTSKCIKRCFAATAVCQSEVLPGSGFLHGLDRFASCRDHTKLHPPSRG